MAEGRSLEPSYFVLPQMMGQKVKREWGCGPSDNITPACIHLVTWGEWEKIFLLLLSGGWLIAFALAVPVGRCAAALRSHGRRRDSFPVCNLETWEWRPGPWMRGLWVRLGNRGFGSYKETSVP